MKLSLRLQCIADFIKDGSSVFDVGADHGNLEIFLSQKRNIKKIVAIDNKKGPFDILRNNTKGLENVETKFSSGLDDFDKSCDTLVIAGMGGMLINTIISEHPECLAYIKQIVIDAHKNIDEVRRYISSIGFKISKEKIVKEKNRYYFVINFEKGEHEEYSKEEIEYGVGIKTDPLFNDYIEYKQALKKQILEQKGKCKNENN